MAERLGADELAAVTWLREWQRDRGRLKLGCTADQKWIAWHSVRGGYAFWDERGAADWLDRAMARGGWRETPVEAADRLHELRVAARRRSAELVDYPDPPDEVRERAETVEALWPLQVEVMRLQP